MSLLPHKGAVMRADDSPHILTRAARERGQLFLELLLDRTRTLPPILRAVATDINFLRLFIQNHAADRGISATRACECLRVLHNVYGYAPPPPDAMRALADEGTHMRRAVGRFIEALYERCRTAIALQRRFVDLGIPDNALAQIEAQLRAIGAPPLPLANAHSIAEARTGLSSPIL